jgi:hypothetical protein
VTGKPEPAALRATGMDDARRNPASAQRAAQQLGREQGQREATTDGDKLDGPRDPPQRNPFDDAKLNDAKRRDTIKNVDFSEGKRMASGHTGNVVPGNRLRVRVPCPPLEATDWTDLISRPVR